MQKHRRAEKPVQHAAELHEIGHRAVLLQAPGIGAAFVPERIVARGDHQRGRQAGQRLGAQRRNAPIAARLLVGGVVLDEPRHRHGVEAIAVVEGPVGLRARHDVGHGIGQQLHAQLRALVVARPDRHGRGQVAAGRVAADRELVGVDADRGAVGPQPLQAAHDIVEGAWEARLGGQAIVDRHHRDAGLDRELRAEHVVTVEVAEHPAATVRVKQAGQLGLRREPVGAIEPDGHGIAILAGYLAVGDRDAVGDRSLSGRAQREVKLARGLRCEGVPGRAVRRGHEVDESLRFGVECHANTVSPQRLMYCAS